MDLRKDETYSILENSLKPCVQCKCSPLIYFKFKGKPNSIQKWLLELHCFRCGFTVKSAECPTSEISTSEIAKCVDAWNRYADC